MLADQVVHRLAAVAVLPETRAALARLISQDAPVGACTPQWDSVIATIYRLLGGTNDEVIQPFAAAWAMLTAAMRRLDHLQDGDASDDPLPTVQHVGAQYNLVFSYYLLATALLDDLDAQAIPLPRLLLLRRLWADTLLRAASGQQRDLEMEYQAGPLITPLDHYQLLAQAKSGAVFALAFGGTAALVTDDPDTIAALCFAGEVYGTLLQFSDDLEDASAQSNTTLTLTYAYHLACAAHGVRCSPHDMHAYWDHIYAAYVEQVERVLEAVTPEVRIGIRQLFVVTFEQRRTGEAT